MSAIRNPRNQRDHSPVHQQGGLHRFSHVVHFYAETAAPFHAFLAHVSC